jgi:hypothetical protein
MISLILSLVIIGVLLYLLELLVPMDATIKQVIRVLVLLIVAIYLLRWLGLYEWPLPPIRG